jgi:hypothetical protein
MYTEEDITSAVKAGIFTQEMANSFREHIANQQHTYAVDEENFRLISGFNDIFIVIACNLLLISVAWIGYTLSPPLGAIAAAMTAWGLAEFFILKRRMALPAIVLLLAFVGSVFMTCVLGLGNTANSLLVASGLSALGAWLHWLRFKVPITVAAGTAASVGLVIAAFFKSFPDAFKFFTPMLFVAGVAVFLTAMYWDSADVERKTRKSDVAFWLHLLAAPLLVHPIFVLLNISHTQVNLTQAIIVVVLYTLIAITSLATDRRALMVSALTYVLYAFSSLLKNYGIVSLGFAITALVIGSSLLLLSAFWHPCRNFAFKAIPFSLQKYLPPLK